MNDIDFTTASKYSISGHSSPSQLDKVELYVTLLMSHHGGKVGFCASASRPCRGRGGDGVFTFFALIGQRRQHRLGLFAIVPIRFVVLLVDCWRVAKDHAYLSMQVLLLRTQSSLKDAGNGLFAAARMGGGARRRWRPLRDDRQRKSLLQLLDAANSLLGN